MFSLQYINKRTSTLILALSIFSFFLISCGNKTGADGAGTGTGTNVIRGTSSTGTLTITPSATSLVASTASAPSTLQLQVSGGVLPYTYVITQGTNDASVTSTSSNTATFRAPATAQTVIVTVTDYNQQNSGYAIFTITTPGSNLTTHAVTTNSIASGNGAVELYCSQNQTFQSGGGAACSNGSQPSQAMAGTVGWQAACAGSTTVTAGLNCSSMMSTGTSYSRVLWATSMGTIQAFCQANETAQPYVATCGNGYYNPTAVSTSSGRAGYILSCASGVIASVGVVCSGVAP